MAVYVSEQTAPATPTAGNVVLYAKTDGFIYSKDDAGVERQLSLLIGTDVQAWDANLDQLAALAVTDGNIIVGNGSAWVAESGATARTSLGLGTGASPTFAGGTFTGLVDLSGAAAGQIQFPATQNASANANTLDDYEEGTWTPTLTFATPGDLSVVYAIRVGFYRKIGSMVFASFSATLSTFTHTTASGTCQITGAPFTAENVANYRATGAVFWEGVTKAGYTDVASRATPNSSVIDFVASTSASLGALVSAADMPTGGIPGFTSSIHYQSG